MAAAAQVQFGDVVVSIFEAKNKTYNIPDMPEAARLERALSWRRRVLSLTTEEVIFCTSSMIVCHNHATGVQRFFFGHQDEVTALCTASHHAASGDVTGIVLVWSLDNLQIKKRLEFHKTPVTAMQFLPNGARPFLITCSLSANGEYPLAVWQVGKEIVHAPARVVNGGKNEVVGLYVMKNAASASFVSYGAHHLKVWYPSLLAPQEPMPMHRASFGQGYTLGCVTCVAEISLGLACGTDTGDVFVLDSIGANNFVARRICGSQASPKTSVVLIMDGPEKGAPPVAIFKYGIKVSCDLNSKEVVRSSIWTTANEALRPILITAANQDMIAMASASHLMIGDARTLTFRSLLVQPPSLQMQSLSVHRGRTVVGTPEGLFVLRNNMIELELPGAVTACLLSDVFVAVAMGPWLRIVDLESGSTCGEKQLQNPVCSLAAFEGLFAAGMTNGGINFFDGPELKQGSQSAKVVICHEGPVTAMAFAGQFLYSCSAKQVAIFDALQGRRLMPGDEMLDRALDAIPSPFTLPYSSATRGAWDTESGERKFSASGSVLCASSGKDIALYPFPTGINKVAPVLLRRVHTSPITQVVCIDDAVWSMSNNTFVLWRSPRKVLQERSIPQNEPATYKLADKSVVVASENDPDVEKAARYQKLIDSRAPHRVEPILDPNAVGRREKLEVEWARKGRLSPKIGSTGDAPKREKPAVIPAGSASFRCTGVFRHKTQTNDASFEIEVRCVRALSKVTKNVLRRLVTFFSDEAEFTVKVPWGYDVEKLEADKKFDEGVCFVTIPKAGWTVEKAPDEAL